MLPAYWLRWDQTERNRIYAEIVPHIPSALDYRIDRDLGVINVKPPNRFWKRFLKRL